MHRIGIGQDSHSFSKNLKRPLVLGGVEISSGGGLSGESDADVVLHSLCNALSSALGGDSLATWSRDMCKRGIKDSQKYVEAIFAKVKVQKYKVENVSISVEAKKPYLEPDTVERLKGSIANLLKINTKQVGITFTSGEGLTSFGQGKGIQSFSQVLLSK